MPRPWAAWSLWLALGAGCMGEVGGGTDQSGPTSGPGSAGSGARSGAAGPAGGPAGSAGSATSPAPGSTEGPAPNVPPPPDFKPCAIGSSPLRRLTRAEINNTIRDLLGDATEPASKLVPEDVVLGFNNNADALTVPPLLAEQLMLASEAIAARATETDALLPCDERLSNDACALEFIKLFGRRAWRRPLTPEEVTRLNGVYMGGRSQYDFRAGIELVVRALLQSPYFLYRPEISAPVDAKAKVVLLDGFEMASRLSYFLWRSMPDDELFNAAASGRLATRDHVAAQATRLLQHPRAKAMVADFHAQWLELDLVEQVEKDPKLFPKLTPGLRPYLRAETAELVERTVFGGAGGDLGTFLTAPFSYMNKALAAYYGLSGPAGEAFERVSLDPQQRAGLLTHAGLLAAHSKPNQTSPVHRGLFVRERLLCTPPPPPPPGLVVKPPDLDPKLTTRERFARHSSDPACAGCHALLDPLGLGFESYDAVGLWRSSENGKMVDASGEMVGTDVAGRFVGARDLGTRLARSADLQGCVVTEWFRYAHGRGEADVDACLLGQLKQHFAGTQTSVKGLILAIATSEAFRARAIEAP